jgi:hypothetical protein
MSWLTRRWYFLAAPALLTLATVAVILAPKGESGHLVRVSEVRPIGSDLWLVPAATVAEGAKGHYLVRVDHLQAQRISVKIVNRQDKYLVVRSDVFRPGDLVVVSPGSLPHDSPLAPVGGVGDERLIGLVLDAGIRAAQVGSLTESMRFVSPNYQDHLGFDRQTLEAFLKRAYKKFDSPRITLDAGPVIEVRGDRGRVQASLRLTAAYRGRRNYLLGNDQAPDQIQVDFTRTAYGWKVDRLSGMRVLGFEEEFLRVLGAEVGLTLSDEEKKRREANCMRCKQRMEERFLEDR